MKGSRHSPEVTEVMSLFVLEGCGGGEIGEVSTRGETSRVHVDYPSPYRRLVDYVHSHGGPRTVCLDPPPVRVCTPLWSVVGEWSIRTVES